jgi:hypothetical protein
VPIGPSHDLLGCVRVNFGLRSPPASSWTVAVFMNDSSRSFPEINSHDDEAAAHARLPRRSSGWQDGHQRGHWKGRADGSADAGSRTPLSAWATRSLVANRRMVLRPIRSHQEPL